MDPACALLPSPSRDIVFHCDKCSGSLVVDAAAAGMTLSCPHCGGQTAVPAASIVENPSEHLVDLDRKLKENDSQRTEVTSYINQLSIQLHRWKLRLQTLDERKAELATKLAALKASH